MVVIHCQKTKHMYKHGCTREAVYCEIKCLRIGGISVFRRMCGHSPRGFSLSWATNQAVDLLAQVKLNQRWWWANPGRNTGTGTRRRKYAGLTNIWMPDNDLKSEHFQLEIISAGSTVHV